jgi:hypothetical protein
MQRDVFAIVHARQLLFSRGMRLAHVAAIAAELRATTCITSARSSRSGCPAGSGGRRTGPTWKMVRLIGYVTVQGPHASMRAFPGV